MLPYILNILKHSGDLQSIPTLCYKVTQFEATSSIPEDAIQQSVTESLQQGIEMGLIRENARKLYGLSHSWHTPESTTFQISLHEVVQNIPEVLRERSPETIETETSQTQNSLGSPQEDCGPGMAQRRSPAQMRAIAIYRRMRAAREQAERMKTAGKQNQGNRRSRTRSRSRSPARSHSRTRRSSAARSRSRARSTPRSRSRSKSQSRRHYTPVASRSRQRS